MANNNSRSESYEKAGVDITAGYRAVELMKKHISRTITPGAMPSIGNFGGLFAPDLAGMSEPILVSGTDGVGTKLKLAFLSDKHNTVGIDCVAMCVNDIICCGAKPLFFLDYIALGKNIPEKVASVVEGVAEGCVQSGCALIGGETAEMPGFYPADEYDLAGFAVGIVTGARCSTLKRSVPEMLSLRCRQAEFIPTASPLCARFSISIQTMPCSEPMLNPSEKLLAKLCLSPQGFTLNPCWSLQRKSA